jgi:hypothetical protein
VKLWIEYGYGKPIAADENQGGPATINVITGVRRDPEFGNWANDPPPARPLLPDGRDPFEQPAPPCGSRPIGRAPVAEPPSTVRNTEGPLKERN